MSNARQETLAARLDRYLRDGWFILCRRGVLALLGAAVREAATIVDAPTGPNLTAKEVFGSAPALLKRYGPAKVIGGLLRNLAVRWDPPRVLRTPANSSLLPTALSFHHTDDLIYPDGVVPARRPFNELDFALKTPFGFTPDRLPDGPVAAIVHAFYTDDMPALSARLANIPVSVDLFFSTDTEAKREEILAATAGWTKGTVEVRTLPNRGRDVAAKFVGFADVYDRYDVFLQLHMKKSPHGGDALARWRDYLFDNLIGTPEIARSNLSLFADPRIGIVFPQHLFELRGVLNWGYDYDLARGLMRRMGHDIDKNHVLEFPSGTMFWGRSRAIRPLLDLKLSYEDFPAEGGHVDGTLAHAIERILLMTAELSGHEWLKVVDAWLYPLKETVLACETPDDVSRHRLRVFRPCLSPLGEAAPPFARWIGEARPISAYPCRGGCRRLNLLVPTINPHQIYGGVGTALRLFHEWVDALSPDVDRRIVVTDAAVTADAYAAMPDYVAQPFEPPVVPPKRAIVDASERELGRLDVRAGDLFVATAWWTATIARRLEKDRARMFGGKLPFVYVIQDDEPHFYPAGAKSELAEETYRDGDDMIAVINSEELYLHMTKKHRLARAYCLPYAMNTAIGEALRPIPREPIILAYARPSVARNAFELVCAGLRLWQIRDPIRASRWQIRLLGESFPEELIAPLRNVRIEAKLDLAAYADRLGRASVGVSLMVSPHPSYPPLEMAEAGMTTIVNAYAGKDLRRRFDDVVSLDRPTAEAVADAIEIAVARRDPMLGTLYGPVAPRALDGTWTLPDGPALAAALSRAWAEA